MAQERTGGFCNYCARPVLVERQATNHVLHLLLTIFTCSLWLIIWVLASIKIGGWRCTVCGQPAKRPLSTMDYALGAVAVGIAGLFVFGLVVTAIVAALPTRLDSRPASTTEAPKPAVPAPPAEAPAAKPKAEVPDALATYRVNVGMTAFNATNGAEQGRIVGVVYEGKGKARRIVYQIVHRGKVRTHPADNVIVRDVPSTVANPEP
jgi:hypothetical protein